MSENKKFDLASLAKTLADSETKCDLEALTQALENDVNPHRVVVDCTKSEAVAG